MNILQHFYCLTSLMTIISKPPVCQTPVEVGFQEHFSNSLFGCDWSWMADITGMSWNFLRLLCPWLIQRHQGRTEVPTMKLLIYIKKYHLNSQSEYVKNVNMSKTWSIGCQPEYSLRNITILARGFRWLAKSSSGPGDNLAWLWPD